MEVFVEVPAGIHVTGEGFGDATAAGTVRGFFEVPQGSSRTIFANVKGGRTGEFLIHAFGQYWPADNKPLFKPISLTHPFTVLDVPPPTDTPTPTPTPTPVRPPTDTPVPPLPPSGGGCTAPLGRAGSPDAGWLLLGMLGVGMVLFKRGSRRRG